MSKPKTKEPKESPDYAPELQKCGNCKHFAGGKCKMSIKEAKTAPENDCFTGQFEPLPIDMMLREAYDNINELINYYMDVPEDKRNIIALWIMGTYFHDNFSTFPYLFINAMRGSGKTRLLKIIASLAKDAQLTNSLTESVMFRTTGTLAIDEFEGVGGKEKTSLRELLNSSYKKGTKVFRMRKKKTVDGENQVVEEFQPYRPVAMANIWGMEEVLGDRCINVLLEKSIDLSKIKLVEDFEDNEIINYTKNLLLTCSWCSLCSVVTKKNIKKRWNCFIKEKYTTLNYTNTYTTLNYTNYTTNLNTDEAINEGFSFSREHKYVEIFEKIDGSEIDGRNLELFFPLFLTSSEISNEHFEKTIIYAKEFANERKVEEITESKDVLVYSLIAKEEQGKWRDIKQLTETFRLINGGGPDSDWINSKYMGRALKRLNLVANKRRMGSGTQVLLNVAKAKEKERIFKPKEDEKE